MAALSDVDRARVWRGLMRYWSQTREPLAGCTKAQLRTAVNETDDWIDTHSGNTSADTVGYNGALSNPFRTNATAAQKTILFCAVAAMRKDVDLARRILGEVD